METFISQSEAETAAIARDLAGKLRPGMAVLLQGDLGVGKTVFARALIRALAGTEDLEVPSPTFTLVQTYETPRGPVWHFDLYRLKDPEEVYELGWDDALAEGIVLIEWPERLGGLAPPAAYTIILKTLPDNAAQRQLTIHRKAVIDHAFILAAGMGTRLRPYTDHCPKPMVPVGGVPMIDQVLDKLNAAGVTDVTVNLHYRARQLAAHLETRQQPRIHLSHETELLDTGGGVKRMLAAMGDRPFYVTAGDSIWTDGPSGSALLRMQDAFDPETMDMLLLLQPLDRMTLTEGRGDYDVAPDGRAIRSHTRTGAYMWTSIRICAPAIFNETPDGAFSFLLLLDRAEAAGKLYAIVHDGDWHHISTPIDLERVDAALQKVSEPAR